MSRWLAVGVAVGPIALLLVWMALVNRRDRRRDTLEATIGVCCAELGLRGAVAVAVRIGVCFGRAHATLDMRLCTAVQVLQVIERLEPRVPPRASVWVVVSGPRSSQAGAPFHRAVMAML